MELVRNRYVAGFLVVAALLGLLVLPLAAQRFLGVNAVTVAFAVIILYAALNYFLQRS